MLTAVAECANANVLSDWLMTIGYRGGPITHSEMEIINSVTELFPMEGSPRYTPLLPLVTVQCNGLYAYLYIVYW